MRLPRALLVRLSSLFGRERLERDLAEELDSHLQMHIEDNLRRGMSPAEARRVALIKLGGMDQTKEKCRDRLGFPALEHFVRDLRNGARAIRRNPGFASGVILTLALGIGANTLVFSVVHALLLRPLPFKDGERLSVIEKHSSPAADKSLLSHLNLMDLKKRDHIFEGVAGCDFSSWPGVLKSGGEAELASLVGVTEDFFTVLGVRPVIGGLPAPGDTTFVMLSYGTWRGFFQGRTDIIGRQVKVDGFARTVAGVMPPDFQLFRSGRPELLLASGAARHPDTDSLECVARLKAGVSSHQAEDALRSSIRADTPDSLNARRDVVFRVAGLRERLFGAYRHGVLTLMAAVAFVLLIACVNVANLMLARTAVRGGELSIRVALGASRVRVAMQVLTESLVLAILGGGLGVGLAFAGLQSMYRLGILSFRGLPPFRIDGPVLAFAGLVALLPPLMCSVAPVLRFFAGMRSFASRQWAGTFTPASWRLSRLMVISGMAFCFVLLVGTGLLVTSFVRLSRVDPGFQAENVMFVDFDDNALFYSALGRRQTFYSELVTSLGSSPGIRATGLTDQVPLSDDVSSVPTLVTLPGRVSQESGSVNVFLRSVDAGFFSVMGIPLKKGRLFSGNDTRQSASVAVINEAFVRRCWGDADPIGRRLRLYSQEPTIIGVVGDVSAFGLKHKPVEDVLYVSVEQFQKGNRVLAVRTLSDPLALAAEIKNQARSIEPSAPVIRVRTMPGIISDSIRAERSSAVLMTSLGGLALVLACIGIYALISFFVSQHSREFAVRIALGASDRQILTMLFGQALRMVVMGTVIGAMGAWAMSRFLSGQLYGVEPGDPLIYGLAALCMAGLGLLACYLPARRAAGTDPAFVLRWE